MELSNIARVEWPAGKKPPQLGQMLDAGELGIARIEEIEHERGLRTIGVRIYPKIEEVGDLRKPARRKSRST